MKKKDFYEEVSAYYDYDATSGFESRAHANRSLNKIRDSFRTFVEAYEVKNVLEIGCGPGLDAVWLATRFPNANITAIDVSPKMVDLCLKNTRHLNNVHALQATEKDITALPEAPFDTICVFFGALNTVDDLHLAAANIHEALRPGGRAVLTFVNKWYLREMLVNLLKFRIKTAFSRVRKIWGGYSPQRFLASTCYAPSHIRKCFKAFTEREHRGYSILFPAWYNDHKLKGKNKKAKLLWNIDRGLNRTPFWKFGEYTLFVFEKPI